MTLPCLFDSQICISITNGGDSIFIFCLDAVLHKKHDLNIQLTFHYLTMELTSLNMKKVFHPKLPSKLVVELIHVGDLNNDRIILFWHFFSCIVQTAHIDKTYERSIMNAFINIFCMKRDMKCSAYIVLFNTLFKLKFVLLANKKNKPYSSYIWHFLSKMCKIQKMSSQDVLQTGFNLIMLYTNYGVHAAQLPIISFC